MELEDREGLLGREEDSRGATCRTLTAACRVTEMDEGTAVYISSDFAPGLAAAGSLTGKVFGKPSRAWTSRRKRKILKMRNHHDSSMDIAPSLITLYDKYASTDGDLGTIEESSTSTSKTVSSSQPAQDDAFVNEPETSEIGGAGDQGKVDSFSDKPVMLEVPLMDEPLSCFKETEEVSADQPNQSFLYKSISSLKSDNSDEEKDMFDTDLDVMKPRSESCPGILDGDNEQSTNTPMEAELECTTAPIESKSRTSTLESSLDSRSSTLEKNSNPPKGKSSPTTPPERTDSNANLRGFHRTLSFGARLARSKFNQFIESNALGKSRSESTTNKKSSDSSSVKQRRRLRSDSEPVPISAVKVDSRRKLSRTNPTVLSTVEFDNGALSPSASPVSTPPLKTKLSQQSPRYSLNYIDQKCKELIDTEESYVMDLGDVIQGYKKPIADTIDLITQDDQDTLFGNIQEIYDFNNKLLKELQECNNDAVLIAECFLDNEKNFRVYTDYCTNYPNTMEVLIHYTKFEEVAEIFKECQLYLGHPLPLGAYLLKPVQRVLKYHLLFQDMHKHFDKDDEGCDTISDALVCMTNIAHYINEMKRKHEAAVHVQEIQSQLVDWEGDLMSSGDLVLEDVFRIQGYRAERYLYLFEKVLLIGKKQEDGQISIKIHIPCSNLMLIESLQKEPMCFTVFPYDNTNIQYQNTVLARSTEQKKLWTHEIKRLILENYGATIPTKVYELILRDTMSTKTESDKEVAPDQDNTQDKKERRSRRRPKRRNSEPLGKLLRGQKQVKAAVESMITKGMKRPELSKWNARRSSGDIRVADNTSDESDNESLDSPCRQSLTRLNEGTPEHQTTSDSTRTPDSSSPDKQPIANNRSQRLSRNSMELGGSVSSTHSDEDRDRTTEQSSLSRKRESNRDSGIGSMTLSEHASTEGDRDANGSSRRGGASVGKISDESAIKEADACQKKNEGSGNDDDAIEELIENMESPDELEALESLPETVDNASVGHEDDVDLETLPSYIKTFSPTEPFKLRHSNIRSYRPLAGHKKGDVWLPMSPETYIRGRSASYGARPLSADVVMHAPPKIPLSRSNSEDRHWLTAVSEMHGRSHSDPNILDTNSGQSSSSLCQSDSWDAKPSSQRPYEENTAYSSNENLLESVNKAFKKLGEKYSQLHLSDNEDTKNDQPKDKPDGAANVSVETKSTKEDLKSDPGQPDAANVKDVESRTEPRPQPRPQPRPRTVIKLAREFSRKAKENPRLVVTRHVFSDPYLEKDGTTHREGFSFEEDSDGHTVVRPKTSRKVTSKIETFQRAMTENESWPAPSWNRLRHVSDTVFHDAPIRSTGSSDEEKTVPTNLNHTSLSRSVHARRSVRDVVRKFEKPSPMRKDSKVVTPTAMGIQQRLQSIMQNAQFHKQTQQEISSSRIKSLRERRQELEECVSRPIPRKYNLSEGANADTVYSDTASYCSDEPDGMSSYASSVQSSTNASPVHVARSTTNQSIPAETSPLSPRSETSEDKMPILFRSLKERFQELEKAVSKPVPKICANPKEEIEAEKQNIAEEKRLLLQSSTRDDDSEQDMTPKKPSDTDFQDSTPTPESRSWSSPLFLEPQTSGSYLKDEDSEHSTDQKKASDTDFQDATPRPESRSCSSPLFLEAQTSGNLHRAPSCESNYTDARSEFSTQDSSEDSFHSGYATPTES